MLKIYIYKVNPNLPLSFLASIFLTEESLFGPLFQKVPTAPFKNMLQLVESPEEADYMMIPHTFSVVEKKSSDYIKQAEKFADTNGMKTIIFAYGDSHDEVNFKNSLVLRTSKYKSKLQSNEIILSPFIEDLGVEHGVKIILKETIPTVGFAGMIGMPTKQEEIRFQLKILLNILGEIIGLKKTFERQGLFFRRRAVKVLSDCSTCKLFLQKRNSFSAAKSTVQGDPKVLRQEFVESIKNSHLPLVIRGNGNYSLRFFEILSLGRVPLFIDTDTPLPLENEIDYDSFMLRVDYKDISKLPAIIEKFWQETSEEQFLVMQRKAREVFETKLSPVVFYKNLFAHLLDKDAKNIYE